MRNIYEGKSFLKCLWLVCILLFSLGMAAQVGTGKKELTQLTGTINLPTAGTIGIKFYRDFISRDEEIYDVPLTEDNRFTVSFYLKSSTPAFLVYNGEEVPIYLDSGDDLFINCKGNDFAKTITFAGKGAGKSRYLKNFNDVFPERNADYIFYELVEREAMDFRRYMDRLHRKMWGLYKSLLPSQKKDFSPDFESFIKADIDYWYAYNLLRYRVEHPISNGIYEPVELPVAYYSFLENLLISNEQALTNPYYLFFIDQYIVFRNHLKDTESQLPFSNNTVKVTAPSMLVFQAPNNPPILEQVEQGTVLKFLEEKTDFTSQIQIKEDIWEDFWYKVVSTTGEPGWIHGSGIQLQSADNQLVRKKLAQLVDSKFDNIHQLFSGKTLFYLLANELYWGVTDFSQKEMEQKISDFIELSPYPSLDSIVYFAYQERMQIAQPSDAGIRIVRNVNVLFSDSGEKMAIQAQTTAGQNRPDSSSVSSNKTTPSEKDNSPNTKIQPRKFQPQANYVDIDPRPADRKTKMTAVSGRIDQPSAENLSLTLYSDPITLEEITHELGSSSDRTFELTLNLAQPAIGFLSYGKDKVEVYLEPGDILQVKFSGNDFLNSLQFIGRGAAHNNFLKAYQLEFRASDKDARKKAATLQQDNYKKLLDEIKSEKINFLNSSPYLFQFSDAFRSYAQANIVYWRGYLLLNYPWEYGLSNDLDGPAPMPITYYDFMTGIPTSADRALPNIFYTYYLDQFFEYQEEHPDNEGIATTALIDKYLDGEPAAFFKAKKLAIACKRGKARKEGENIKAFIESNPYEVYNDVLRLVYNEARGLQIGMSAPDFELADINGNEVQLSALKGKVVYLDFWATWCSPCIHQMKNSKIWKSNLADEDVVFVYVSLDKNRAAWEEFLEIHKFKGTHVIATGGDVYKSQIAKLYKVKKLPTYYLIDKQGKIAYQPERGQNIKRVEEKIQNLLHEGR
ncbi:MAG: redoxin domain-containing protein [Bacteroidota bacterium]